MAEEKAELAEVVPQATFIEDVAAYVQDRPIDDVLREVRETLQRYNYVAQEMSQRRQRLTIKEPEIRKCLDAVNLLIAQQETGAESTVIDFSLSDQAYARAKVSNVGSVGLWLGANVMVEYSLEEARTLLERQLAGCRSQLVSAQRDYDYVRDQVTTMEVSLARIYNYDVARRKAGAVA